jgi:hypothetical protein
MSAADAERERLKDLIRRAFASAKRPPAGSLHDSEEGEEPRLLEVDFADKQDWRVLDGAFLDQAPDGYGSALSFFSNEALRYFGPAYLIADLEGQLERVDVASRLSGPFTDEARTKLVNPPRYGDLTLFESARQRFAAFTREEVAAIVAYLEYKAATDEFEGEMIRQALANYWRPRLEALSKPPR